MNTGFIYKITCLSNNKIYIGQTVQHYNTRFIQHKSHARTGQSNHKLANAIRKYGEDNFIVEPLEECNIDLLDEKERFWIDYYDSTNDDKGYNILLGGQSCNRYQKIANESEIIEFYKKCHNQQKTYQHFGITDYKFRQILLRNNIPTDYTNYGNYGRKKVKIIELDLEFDSEKDCAKYFIENNICQTKKVECAAHRVNFGIRNNKKVYGYTLELI